MASGELAEKVGITAANLSILKMDSCGRSSSWAPPLFITFSEIPMKSAFWDE